ncbi:hypothetical protein [Gaopeijia maritima]|uniref:GlsB/YeaQ/YmgE family stress response membrane protein n=1 Tax=Gaopeijia maritima TaxID=3119007 RepID=A0ABU9E5J9_9BACT
MENWIGIGIWIVMGVVIGMIMKSVVSNPDETPGHATVLAVLGAFAAVIGGMLGVGIFHFEDPLSLSLGGMLAAAVFAAAMTFIYRWGVKSLI